MAFGQTARAAGIAVSMGSRSDRVDNAIAESFFANAQQGAVPPTLLAGRRELIGEVFEYIEAFFNPVRRHSRLG